MKRAEIERKFDEIVAFAEIEKFIDTPVKHYSSGMCVRLAFAVAAHRSTWLTATPGAGDPAGGRGAGGGGCGVSEKVPGEDGDGAKEGRTVLRSQAGEDGGRISRLISSIR